MRVWTSGFRPTKGAHAKQTLPDTISKQSHDVSKLGGGLASAETEIKVTQETLGNIRLATNECISDIGDVRSGLYTIATADDIKGLKEAHTTLFAEIDGKAKAQIDAYVVSVDGKERSFMDILADQITLESAVEDAFVELELKANSSTVEDLDGTVKTIQSAQAELTTRVGKAETTLLQKAEKTTVQELDESVKTLYTGQSNLATRVGNAESSLLQKVSATDFDDAMAAEQTAITELQSCIDNLESGLSLKVSSADLTKELKNYALAKAAGESGTTWFGRLSATLMIFRCTGNGQICAGPSKTQRRGQKKPLASKSRDYGIFPTSPLLREKRKCMKKESMVPWKEPLALIWLVLWCAELIP